MDLTTWEYDTFADRLGTFYCPRSFFDPKNRQVSCLNGRIYSIESMGLVDGPGIRYVVFLQGCSIKCSFCHNPDSQCISGGTITSSDELIGRIERFRPYFERSGGGVTFSGGEPLMQSEFLLEMLKLCKKRGIHTCLDTSGAVKGDFNEILKYTDLVLYDVKAVTPKEYKEICGGDISITEDFQKLLCETLTDTTVRQVVIPGINDSDEYMIQLKSYVNRKLPHANRIELLPYHLLGSHKYKASNIPEPLAGIPAMDKSKTEQLQTKFFS